jgi:hypothetical protein
LVDRNPLNIFFPIPSVLVHKFCYL